MAAAVRMIMPASYTLPRQAHRANDRCVILVDGASPLPYLPWVLWTTQGHDSAGGPADGEQMSHDFLSQKKVREILARHAPVIAEMTREIEEACDVQAQILSDAGGVEDTEDTPRKPFKEWRERFQRYCDKQSLLRKSLKKKPVVHAKCYLHVSNSGVVVSVVDEGHGATLRVTSNAFGNISLQYDVHTNRESLAALGVMLLAAAQREYSDDYSAAAAARTPKMGKGSARERAAHLGFDLDEAIQHKAVPPREEYDFDLARGDE